MLAERDDEIAKLVEKLREAGLEMENNASFMEDVKSRLLRGCIIKNLLTHLIIISWFS